MSSRYGVRLALCAVLALLASCGGGDSTSPPVAVGSVSVSVPTASIAVGATVQATAVVKDANGATLTGRTVTWSSSNTSVLTIANTGVATAVSAGTANIVATSEGVTGQATISVAPPPVNNVTVTLANASVLVGATVQASAVLKDATGATLSGRTVTWSSSNPAVATVVASTGLATAVGAGTTNIVATSEGVNGQATLTVTAPPVQLGALTLTDPATGAALNLSNLAGSVSVRSNLQIPAGTSGTVVVRIDGREFGRQSVAASIVTSAFMDLANASAVNVDVNVPISVSTISSSELANTSITSVADLLNGPHSLTVDYTAIGATQPSASGQVGITTATPDVFTGYVTRTGTLRSLNGNSWSSDDMRIDLVPVRFGAAPATGASASLADYLADFRVAPPTGVVDLFGKSSTDMAVPVILPKATFGYESKSAIGSRLFLKGYSFGSTAVSPQTAEPNLNGNCINTGGTGFIPNGPVTLPPLPPTCLRWITVNPIPQTLLGATRFDISSKFYHDTKAPTALAGAFTLPDRTSGANQNAFGLPDSYGVVDNWVGRGLLDVGINRTKLSDAGSGVDVAAFREFNFGTTPTFTPNASNRFTRVDELLETGGQRTAYFKAGVTDGVGNLTYLPLTTSLRNPYTVGGALSTNFGVDPAAVAISRDGGSFSVTGPATGYVTKSPASAAAWNLSLSGSFSGYSANSSSWVRAYKDDDPSKVVYGESAPSQAGWWMGSSGSTASSSSLSYSALVAQSISRLGGTGEGAYTISFGGVDRAGNAPTGSPWTPFTSIYDATPPTATITGNGPFASGSSSTVRVSVTDNVGIAGYAIGPVFDLPHPGFQGSYAYVVPGQIPLGMLNGPLVRSFAFDVTDVVPNGLVFHNPVSGAVNTSRVYNTIGVAGYARDWAYNYGATTSLRFPNTATFSVPTDPSAVRFSIGSSSGCNGTGCAGGLSNIMNVTASWDSPSATSPFSKYEVYALSGDGRVNFLRAAPAATRTTISASLFRYETSFTYDWSQYCSTTTSLQIFGLAQSLDRKYWYKPEQFSPYSLTVPAGGNAYCTLKHAF